MLLNEVKRIVRDGCGSFLTVSYKVKGIAPHV
jgi:hypothetical protein